jgi:hypothetical protein
MWFLWRSDELPQPPGPLADDDPVLAALASDIAARRGALAGLRARSDHVSTLVTLYALALWAAYHTAWYFGFVAAGSPVFVGPIMWVLSSVRVEAYN